MRLLLLSRWFPYPPDNGSKLRIWNNLQHLAARHDVTLITFGDPSELADTANLAKLREHCKHVVAVPYRPFRPSSPRALTGLFSTKPRWLVDTHSPALAFAVAEEAAREQVDMVVASQLEMAPYALQLPNVPAVLEELELSIIREAPQRATSFVGRRRSALTWFKLRNYIRNLLPHFAAVTVASEVELASARQLVPQYHNLRLVPNAVQVRHYAGDFGAPQPDSLVFSGALTYHANYDAVQYYLREIHARVVDGVPHVVVRVTGSTKGVDLAGLSPGTGIEYTGYVPDIRPVIAQSWASIVPLRHGGGTRLKILEAMALGTPVVSTSKGAEGLEARDRHEILLADTPRDFAERVVELLRSTDLRRQLGDGGRRLVASKYDACVVGEQLCALVESVRTAA